MPSCIHREGCLEPSRCRVEERCCSYDIRPPETHPRVAAGGRDDAAMDAGGPRTLPDAGARDAR